MWLTQVSSILLSTQKEKIMGINVNSVQIIGRLGNDIEVKSSQHGDAYCRLSIATNYSQKNHETNQYEKKTDWISVFAKGKTAENLGQYAQKGDIIRVDGSLKVREKNGTYEMFVMPFRIEWESMKPKETSAPKPTQGGFTRPTQQNEDGLPF